MIIYIYIFLYSNLTYADRHHRQESSGRRRGLCTFLGLQRNLGHRLFGNLEKKGRRIGLQVGHFGSKRRPTCRAQAFIHGKFINVSTHHLSSNLLIQVSSNFIPICFLYLSVYFFTFFFLSLFPWNLYRARWKLHLWLEDWNQLIPDGRETCSGISSAFLSSPLVCSSFSSWWYSASKYRFVTFLLQF